MLFFEICPNKLIDLQVTITTRHLLSHTSGIRHYELKSEYDKRKEKQKKKEKRKEQDDDCEMEEEDDKCDDEFSVMKKKKKTAQLLASLSMRSKKEEDNDSEFKLEEYHIKETFKDTKEALKLFQDDELFFKPGKKPNRCFQKGWQTFRDHYDHNIMILQGNEKLLNFLNF